MLLAAPDLRLCMRAAAACRSVINQVCDQVMTRGNPHAFVPDDPSNFCTEIVQVLLFKFAKVKMKLGRKEID